MMSNESKSDFNLAPGQLWRFGEGDLLRIEAINEDSIAYIVRRDDGSWPKIPLSLGRPHLIESLMKGMAVRISSAEPVSSPDISTLDREALARMVTELQGERNKVMRALESLTPGGSEFVGDVDACVAHIRARQSSMLESIKRQVRLRAGLANERDHLTARLAAARAEVERLTTELAEAERMFTFAANKGNRHLESLRKTKAENARLRAALAQVGETLMNIRDYAAQAAQVNAIPDYWRGRQSAAEEIIELSPDLATIGAASAPDNAISQAPANSDTLAALTERILNLKSYLDNAPNIELDTSNVRALVDNLAAIVAPGAETTNALRSDPTRPCCPECNEEKNLAYLQTNAEAEEWLCKNCRHHFQFKPLAEGQEGDDGKD